MFKNYLKVALRNIIKHKAHSLINITGLAIGLACSMLIGLWIWDELSYDRFHENFDNVYRIVMEKTVAVNGTPEAMSPIPLAPALKEDYPEFKYTTRYKDSDGWTVKYKDKMFFEDGVCFVDYDFFEMFTFPLIRGDMASLFDNPNSVIITQAMSWKYFGDGDPLGEVININNRIEVTIVGIISDAPENSHIHFGFILPFKIMEDLGRQLDSWGDVSYYTYVYLDKDINIKEVNDHINECIANRSQEENDIYRIQALRDIHLRSTGLMWDVSGQGDITYIYVLSVLAILILLIACANFMNLSTARSSSRFREIGIRKIVGANRVLIIEQFLGEAILISLLALILALIIVEIFLTPFNSLTGKLFDTNDIFNINSILAMAAIAILTGIIAGCYPAFILSSLKPIAILRGGLNSEDAKSLFRSALVVFQFSITLILIFGTLVIFNQMSFIQGKKLGYDKDNILYVQTGRHLRDKIDLIKNELVQNPRVLSVSSSVSLLNDGKFGSSDGFSWESKAEDENITMYVEAVDYDYFKTLGMDIIEGRDFSKAFSTDSLNVILNEAAWRATGIESPIGKKFTWLQEGEIIGIVKDYNFKSLHREIEPLVLVLKPGWASYIYINVEQDDILNTIAYINSILEKIAPDLPIECRFLNDDLNRLYGAEKQMGLLFTYSSALAIFISCLGLLGLISFITEKRKKEIGIRKVLGASDIGVVGLLIREFIILVVIANIITWPLAFFAMSKWLENFAYRANIGILPFLQGGFAILIITLLTVCYQAIKASRANPINAIQHE